MGGMEPFGDIMGTSAGPEEEKKNIDQGERKEQVQ